MILVGQASLRRAISELIARNPIKRNHQSLDNRVLRTAANDPSFGERAVTRGEGLGGFLSY